VAPPPDEDPKPEGGARPQRGIWLAAFMFGLMLLLVFGAQDGLTGFSGEKIDLGELRELLKRNEVKEIRFKEDLATVKLLPGNLGRPKDKRDALTFTINFNSKEHADATAAYIAQLVEDRGIDTKIHAEHANAFLTSFIVYFLPTLILIGVLYFLLFRQFRGPGGPGSLMNFGKSRHKVVNDKVKVTLKDVAGVEEARQDIEEIISFLKDPGRFTRLGGRMPKGVLLVGPPGTGKTLLAKATAGEAGVPFYSVSGSDFVEMFVGVGASRVRDLFEKAKETSPCIIFLDEVDAVGRRRGGGMGGGGHDEREQTLNQILVEMDGFDTDRGIIIMAATNRPDILDPALLRPGRFDRQIVIGMPNVEARAKILEVHARGKVLASDVDLALLARATPTFSGAELEALLNEAALAAAVGGQDDINMRDLEEARDRIRFGRAKKSWHMLEEEVRSTAYHEAGHALVAALVKGCDPLHKVTVVPRGRALGMTMSLPERDQLSLTRSQVEARICMAFGGRIGESAYTNDLSTGAQNDIQQATELARRMVTEWGMSDALGPIKFASSGNDLMYLGGQTGRVSEFSEDTMRRIDDEMRLIIDTQYKRAEQVIADHAESLARIAEALVKYETVSGEEIDELIAGRDLNRPVPAVPRENPPAGDAEGTDVEGTDAEGTGAEGTDAEGTDAEGTDAEGTDAEGTDAEGTEAEGTEAEGTEAEGTEADSKEGEEPRPEVGETQPAPAEGGEGSSDSEAGSGGESQPKPDVAASSSFEDAALDRAALDGDSSPQESSA
jgi:cell division protease FtsH